MPENIQGQQHDRTALILYGSETGNSQDVAEELGRVAERLHFVTRVSEMDLIAINELLNYTIVIFAISTTGQGEFPKNSRIFWKSLLRKRLPPGCLDHVSFTTFGLGDSSYPKFNWSARKLHKRLEQLGAKEVYPRGEADEQHEEGIDGSFLSWSVDLRKHLLASYPLPDGVIPLPPDAIPPSKYQLVLCSSGVEDNMVDPNEVYSTELEVDIEQRQPRFPHERKPSSSLKGPSSYPETIDTRKPPSNILPIPGGIGMMLTKNVRITPPDHWQDVRKLTFLTKRRHCSRQGKEVPFSDAYHQKTFDCAKRCGSSCRGVCSNCTDYCSGRCRECDETYHPGDTLTIYPKNFPEDVDELIRIMGWDEVADKTVSLKSTDPNYFDHDNKTRISNVKNLRSIENSTFRDLLIHNLDITAIPSRIFFMFIAAYSNDPLHKERLLEFGNPAHRDEYFDYATRPRRSILEVLQDFSSSVKIPWNEATNIFPVIRGRPYSIASGGFLKDCEEQSMVKVELVIALVKYKTILKKIRQGLCSRYIASLPEETMIRAVFDSNKKFDTFTKQRPDLPIIMIAPGTGIAPCRSLIWERARERVRNGEIFKNINARHFQLKGFKELKPDTSSTDPVPPLPDTPEYGETVLFFGNRNKDADYLFKDEWKLRELRLQVFTAFSRDQRQKIYIQDVIRKEGKLIVDLIKQDALIYVCGSSGSMPKAVRTAIIEAIVTERNATWDEAEELIQRREKMGGYIQETW